MAHKKEKAVLASQGDAVQQAQHVNLQEPEEKPHPALGMMQAFAVSVARGFPDRVPESIARNGLKDPVSLVLKHWLDEPKDLINLSATLKTAKKARH